MDYSQLSVSDGTGETVVANIESNRAISSTTIDVDSVENFPQAFIAASGDVTAEGFIDPDTMTVFVGHLDSGDIIIDAFAPGYSDAGNSAGQIVVIKPNTYWADEIVRLAQVSHENDGTLKESAIVDVLGADKGILGNVEIYEADDTWTKPAGLKFVEVLVIAGGGGGGGAVATDAVEISVGSGGGAGGASQKKIAAASLGATVAVTVGAGGAGGSGAAGSNGNDSSFGAHCSATKGLGGGHIADTTTVDQGIPGGAGGLGLGGDLNMKGGEGYSSWGIGSSLGRVFAGHGGNSFLSGGGIGNKRTTGGAGLYGAGGGGVAKDASQAGTVAGGAGGTGIVIVKEYF